VLNLVSGRQLMNYSTIRLTREHVRRIWTVGRERDEIIFEGTDDALITGDTQWKEYESKPSRAIQTATAVRRPISTRIDWQIWFAAMLHPPTIRGRCTLYGNFCIMIPAHSRSLRIILPRRAASLRPRTLYRYSLRRLARKWWKRERIGECCPLST